VKSAHNVWSWLVGVALLALCTGAVAYERYDNGCDTCHGSFLNSTSAKPGNVWSGSKHDVHRNSMLSGSSTCKACHVNTGDNPLLYRSGGTTALPGREGCLGCHGRSEGGVVTGAGLRRAHAVRGITQCGGCHSDPTPVAESVMPPYYGRTGVRITAPCNGDGTENWTSDGLGLDNDGNGLRDAADGACAPACTVTVAVSVSPAGSGTVAGGGVADCGDTVVLTASANTGRHFQRWTQGGVLYSESNPLTIMAVSGDLTLVAEFALNTYTVTYLAGAGGTLNGAAVQSVAHGGTTTPVEAVPDAGSGFARWSDGRTDNPRTDANVTAALTATAEFAVQTPSFDPPAPHVFAGSLAVAMSTGTAGATVRYTTDGSDPVSGSTLYAGPVTLDRTTTLKARAFRDGMVESAVISGIYTRLADAQVIGGHEIAGAGYVPGGACWVRCRIEFTGTPDGLGWSATIPAGWSYAGGTGEADSRPRPGDEGTLEWTWTTIPSSPVEFTYRLNVPSGEHGTTSLAAMVRYRYGGGPQQVAAEPQPLSVGEMRQHAADTGVGESSPGPDFRLSQEELMRVIQLYDYRAGAVRTGDYHLQAGTEDGYASGTGSHDGPTHSADTGVGEVPSAPNWRLGQDELMRVIQLYNYRAGVVRTGEYHAQAGTEDGYASGPAAPAGKGLEAPARGLTAASHTASPSGYTPGAMVCVTCSLAFEGTASSLGWSAAVPPGWSYAGGADEPGTKPRAGDQGTLEWTWTAAPVSPVEFSYWLAVPQGEHGPKQLSGTAKLRDESSGPQSLVANPGPLALSLVPLTVTFQPGAHGALAGGTPSVTLIVTPGGSAPAAPAVAPEAEWVFTGWFPALPPTITTAVETFAQYAAAGPVAPGGSFVAKVAAPATGRGWWDLSGPYAMPLGEGALTLDLVHDTRGRLTGTASYTLGEDTAVPLSVRGTVRGKAGAAVARIRLRGADEEEGVEVGLALNLALDPDGGRLVGRATGTVAADGMSLPIDAQVGLPIPAPMDGTWALLLQLVPEARGIGGTAVLRLANGAEQLYTVKGRNAGQTAALLSLSADPADPLARGTRLKLGVTTLAGGWARLESFSGRGYGQTLAW
jgi:hypothetical protein